MEGTGDLPTQAVDLEAPPKEQAQQEKHAEEAADEAKRIRNTRPAIRRRQQAFAKAYSTPGTPVYLNATKAAVAAGYAPKAAGAQGCALLKKPRIREWIVAFSAETAEKMAAETAVSVEYVKQQHLQQMHECRAVSDRTNAREHLEDLGRMVGAYDVSLHLDLTVKHEYDERLAIEASRLARLALEEMGDRALGLPAPAIEVSVEQRAPESTNAAPVGVEVGVGGDRPLEGTLAPHAEAPATSGEVRCATCGNRLVQPDERNAEAYCSYCPVEVRDHDGHPVEEG